MRRVLGHGYGRFVSRFTGAGEGPFREMNPHETRVWREFISRRWPNWGDSFHGTGRQPAEEKRSRPPTRMSNNVYFRLPVNGYHNYRIY